MKPRDVGGSRWWLDNEDGTVTLVILRRVGAAEGSWRELTFTADTEAGARALYDEACRDAYERATRQAARREKWGITDLRMVGALS